MKFYQKRIFNFQWILYPNKGLRVTVYAYDLKQARKLMLKHVKSNFHAQLGQSNTKNRKGYFKQISSNMLYPRTIINGENYNVRN